MIKFNVSNGLVHAVTPVVEIPNRNGGDPFRKRELIINDSWEGNGKTFSSFVAIEFTGDRMPLLDAILPGTRVNVEGVVNGREYNGRYFTSVRGMSVAPAQPMQSATPAYPQPVYPPRQGYPQSYPQQGGYQPPVDPNRPVYQQGYPPRGANPFGMPQHDDSPF